jgi:hypothetical protein
MTPENRDISLLGNGSVNRFLAERNTHTTIEELPLLYSGRINTPL